MTFKRRMVNFEDCLIESLKDPEEARMYLVVVLEEYIKDHDINSLCDSLRYIAAAKDEILEFPQKKVNTTMIDQLIKNSLSLEWERVIEALGITLSSLTRKTKPIF